MLLLLTNLFSLTNNNLQGEWDCVFNLESSGILQELDKGIIYISVQMENSISGLFMLDDEGTLEEFKLTGEINNNEVVIVLTHKLNNDFVVSLTGILSEDAGSLSGTWQIMGASTVGDRGTFLLTKK
jgi:hypothetical protein